MQHKTYIEKYNGSLETLAEEIGNLRYDALANFLRCLSIKIAQDGEKDYSRNRVKLAACLEECSRELSEAAVAIKKAWDISSPYCQDNNDNSG